MRNAVVENRLTLDETSLDFRGIETAEVESQLDQLNDTLDSLRRHGLNVRVHPWLWADVECLDGCSVCDFIYQPGTSTVSRDTLRLLGSLLDKCTTWNEDEPGFLDSVEIEPANSPDLHQVDKPRVRLDPAFSLGIALSRVSTRAMACLVFAGTSRRGFWTVPGSSETLQTYFFAKVQELPAFWRSLYPLERITEKDFFVLTEHAFPALVFHPSLDFRHFDGSYLNVRDAVVRILGVVNDHFARVISQQSGIPRQVAAALGQFGVDLSPESPNTRSSPRLMAMRDVTLDGRAYRCEWHAKLEPHRNRIHFSLPRNELNGKVVIGIFVDHLST